MGVMLWIGGFISEYYPFFGIEWIEANMRDAVLPSFCIQKRDRLLLGGSGMRRMRSFLLMLMGF